MTQKKIPPVHAELIKLWADGALIQWQPGDQSQHEEWQDCHNNLPAWLSAFKYRVKPEPKPDVVMYAWIHKDGDRAEIVPVNATSRLLKTDTCMFVFNGETGALKDVQLLAKE